MPENEDRKHRVVVNLSEDFPGADPARDLLRVSLDEQSIEPLMVDVASDESVPIDLETINGVQQGGVDLSAHIPVLSALADALSDEGDSDELRTLVYGPNSSGELKQTQTSRLDTGTKKSTVGQVTYLARALNKQGFDELVSRITDASGKQINPATEALEAALKSNDTDEFLSRIVDTTGTEVDPLTRDVTVSRASEAVRVATINDEAQEYAIQPIHVAADELWQIDSNETLTVTNATVDGTMVLQGTLEVYGTVDGAGTIAGSGTIKHMEVP